MDTEYELVYHGPTPKSKVQAMADAIRGMTSEQCKAHLAGRKFGVRMGPPPARISYVVEIDDTVSVA